MNRLALALALLAAPVAAQAPVCVGAADAAAVLAGKAMTMAAQGDTFRGAPFEVWTAPDGTWVAIVRVDQLVCIVTHGDGWLAGGQGV